MKKIIKVLIVASLFVITGNLNLRSQVTIGSGAKPNTGALLDLKESDINDGGQNSTRGLLFPRVELTIIDKLSPMLSGVELDDDALKLRHKGMVVYNTNNTIPFVEGLYAWNGQQWQIVTPPPPPPVADATRFVGGTVLVKYDQITGGTLPAANVIGNGIGTHSMGSFANMPNQAGGINSILGGGFFVSNWIQGIYDIKFDIPFNTIYGVTSNIIDVYQVATAGQNPDLTRPGTILKTIDNTQIAYIDKFGIRIKTGNSAGETKNRSFTFMVTGK